jgi:hypothetical protein
MVRLFIVGGRQGALADRPIDEVVNKTGRHVMGFGPNASLGVVVR